MKKVLYYLLLIISCFSCTETSNLIPEKKEKALTTRDGGEDKVTFYDGLGSGTWNSTTQEWEITISGDFEILPKDGATWISYSNKKVKVRCKCPNSCSGQESGCDPYVILTEPIEYGCDDYCSGTENCTKCKQRTRVTNTYDDNTIATYEDGAEVRSVN